MVRPTLTRQDLFVGLGLQDGSMHNQHREGYSSNMLVTMLQLSDFLKTQRFHKSIQLFLHKSRAVHSG
jgi:hypothetical protein